MPSITRIPFDHWFNVMDYGAVGDGVVDDTAAIQSAIAAMVAAGGGIVYLPIGTYLVTALTITKGSLVGEGLATVIRSSGQTGAVLDLDGYSTTPGNFQWANEFGNFAIEGDNAADATKTHYGIRIASATGVTGVRFHDISISKTGGACLSLETETDFCLFENISLYRPIGANTNDVPYGQIIGVCNGNIFQNLALRSPVATVDGATTDFLIDKDTVLSYYPGHNAFYNTLTEWCHLPDGGSAILCRAPGNAFFNHIDADSVAVTGATDACILRLTSPSTSLGGSLVFGKIPGRVGVPSGGFDAVPYGVIVEGHRNSIIGTRGNYGYNVWLKSGSTYNFVQIAGGAGPIPGNVGVVDDSADIHTFVFDANNLSQLTQRIFNATGTSSNTSYDAYDHTHWTTPAMQIGTIGDAATDFFGNAAGGTGYTALASIFRKLLIGTKANLPIDFILNAARVGGFVAGGHFDATGKVLATGGIGVGNSAAASTPGSVVKKIQVFDASGNSLGYVPVYDAIT